ncbi:RING finger protein 17 [Salarias fasciatus]|uniref:RING finger protein 17 n=1 Tax=Salarias fasciatus TaxID=181472 RepID=UPI0011769A67|nr:RING finger protein 17 [Salarias fasciatus]
MMEEVDLPDAAICKSCGKAYELPEEGVGGNLPRVLFCAHIYCTVCLQAIKRDNVIQCPECKVNSTLDEGGVLSLQQDARITGLIYTTKINKMKSSRHDKPRHRRRNKLATSEGSSTRAGIAIITSNAGISGVFLSDMKNIEKALDVAVIKAAENIVQLQNISKVRTAPVSEQVKRKMAQLEMEIYQASDKAISAVQKWKDSQLRRLTKLEIHFNADEARSKVQERIQTLKIALRMAGEVRSTPSLGQYYTLDKVLETLLAPVDEQSMELKCITPDPGISSQQDRFDSKSPEEPAHCKDGDSIRPSEKELPSPQTLPPTGPELANDKRRIHKMRKKQSCCTKKVSQWVVVTHIVNPNHFYVQYVAEKKEHEALSEKIGRIAQSDSSFFTSTHTLETGFLVFAKWKDGRWSRARVVDLQRSGCADSVESCVVTRLAAVRVFFLDCGLTKSIPIQSEDDTTESALMAVNRHLRKVRRLAAMELASFPCQAVRCSLKDLVPFDQAKGWSVEATVKFSEFVGTSAVQMCPLGQDSDSLLVDLLKTPVHQCSSAPLSVKVHLVFIEVARFFCPVTPEMTPLKFYSPVCPKTNTVLRTVVSHVNSPSDFYIQVVDSTESSLLSAKLQGCYSAAIPPGDDEFSIHCPVIGQACVARFDDETWCRAQILGHLDGIKVEVFFVDYGNTKIVSVSDLRKIKDEFFALPSMAVHCSLSDVVPAQGATWSDASNNRFILLAHQKPVTVVATAKAQEGKPLPVMLFVGGQDEPLTNISEHLVDEGLACFKERVKPPPDDLAVWDPPLELCFPGGEIDAPNPKTPGHQEEEPQEFSPQLKIPAQLKDLEVRVTHINSPSSFYVQFVQNDSQLQSVNEKVKQECELSEPQDVAWKTDMYCAALINGVWERGQIVKDVTSSDTAEVRLCDYGNTVKVALSELRPLPPSLTGSLALECSLDDIRPAGGRSTWTDTACDLFSCYATTVFVLLTIKEVTDERPMSVTLFGSNKVGQLINISDFLTKEGLALRKRTPRDAVVENLPKPDAAPSGNEIHIETSSYDPPALPRLSVLQMSVSAIGDDGLIYARTRCAEFELEQLKERIQQSMKTLPRQKHYTWKSVLGCAVIGPDMLWYRGKLLEVLGGHVTVQYVDYGLVENIPVVHVYPVLLCEDVPQLCLPCQLLGVNPVGGKWQQDALALLKEVLLNRTVLVHVVELPADPDGPLTVEIFLGSMSVSKILCHHEYARIDNTVSAQKGLSAVPSSPILQDWDLSTEGLLEAEEPMLGPFIEPKLPEKELFKIRVKHLQTPNEVFVWPVEETTDVDVDGETLDEALTRVNAGIDSLPCLTNFPFGGPCLAEYSDGKYYRARLMKITSVEPVSVLVQHVDFGSYDDLPVSKLRQMPADLMRFPSRALKVRVGGFKAPHVNVEDEVLPYSPEWSVKAAMDMIELLHDNITATVVAREPRLTVLLFNKDGEPIHLPLVHSGLAELE